ncbi:MAG: low-specificity L-threonine aldolase [Acidimicrobiales bacterium]
MIDLRSDTVTKPTDAMWNAMRNAPLGDDVLDGDPSVRSLEAFAAELLGKEAAIFASSGTQTNLLAIMSHCGRGDEYIVGQMAHTYRWEGGGAAVLGSVQPQPISNQPDGTMDLAAIEAAIKPDDIHFAMSRLICLENTTNGQVIPLDYQQKVRDIAARHGLSLHLDGARMFNAVVALGCTPREFAAPFDSVSVCLSKGLGIPVGSVLVGSADLSRRPGASANSCGRHASSRDARSGGRVALRNNIDRLADDHANAARLAAGLSQLDCFHGQPSNDGNQHGLPKRQLWHRRRPCRIRPRPWGHGDGGTRHDITHGDPPRHQFGRRRSGD